MFNVYPATKFALNGLAQTFRQELRFHGGNIKFTVSGLGQHTLAWSGLAFANAMPLGKCPPTRYVAGQR